MFGLPIHTAYTRTGGDTNPVFKKLSNIVPPRTGPTQNVVIKKKTLVSSIKGIDDASIRNLILACAQTPNGHWAHHKYATGPNKA